MKGGLLEGEEEEEEGGFGEDFFVGVLDGDVFFSMGFVGGENGVGLVSGWVGMMTDHD